MSESALFLERARCLWPKQQQVQQQAQQPDTLTRPWPEQILAGQILQVFCEEAVELADRVWLLLEQSFAGLSLPDLHQQLDNQSLQNRLAELRQSLPSDPQLQGHYLKLLTSLELDPEQIAIDFPRLRAIVPGAEHLPAAAAVYYAHRDTWYANPAGQINLWLPLRSYPAEQTFLFWPAAFGQAVPNDSAEFDYTAWKSQTGFQAQSQSEGSYPQALTPPGPALDFACQQGEILLFAAAHLHQTRPNPGPQIRYSLDLRWVWPHAQAADPDNQSKGSTLSDYHYLQAPQQAAQHD